MKRMKEKIAREDINRTESVSGNNTQTTPTRRHGEEYKKRRVLPLCLRLGELTKHTRKKPRQEKRKKVAGERQASSSVWQAKGDTNT